MPDAAPACHRNSGPVSALRAFVGTLPGAMAVAVLVGGLAYLLVTESARALALLPFGLLLLCPLMHVFMHRGHGGGHGDSSHAMRREQAIHDEVDALEHDKARVGPFVIGH